MSAESKVQWGCRPGSAFDKSKKRISYEPSRAEDAFGVPLSSVKSLWPRGQTLPGTPQLPWWSFSPEQAHLPFATAFANSVYENFSKALNSLTEALYLDNASAESAGLRRHFDTMWSRGVTPADASSCEIFTNSTHPGLQADVAVTLALKMRKLADLKWWQKPLGQKPTPGVLRSLAPAGSGTPWRVVTNWIVRHNSEEKLAASFFAQLPASEKYKVVHAFIDGATQDTDPSILYDGVTLPVFYTFGLLITCDVLLNAGIMANRGQAGRDLVGSLLPIVQERVERAVSSPRPSVGPRPSVRARLKMAAARPSVDTSATAARPSVKRTAHEPQPSTAEASSRKLAEVDKSNTTTAETPPAGQKNRTLILAALAVALTAAGAWVYTRRKSTRRGA